MEQRRVQDIGYTRLCTTDRFWRFAATRPPRDHARTPSLYLLPSLSRRLFSFSTTGSPPNPYFFLPPVYFATVLALSFFHAGPPRVAGAFETNLAIFHLFIPVIEKYTMSLYVLTFVKEYLVWMHFVHQTIRLDCWLKTYRWNYCAIDRGLIR